MAGSGSLTTHVLDTMRGKPAEGMRIDLMMAHGDHSHHVLSVVTNADGRVDEPLLGEGRWGHGTFDPVVVLQRGVDSRAALEALGYRVDWHTYPMPHAVHPQEIADLRRWIGERLR